MSDVSYYTPEGLKTESKFKNPINNHWGAILSTASKLGVKPMHK